jgi:hypothetical protein
MAKTVVKIPNFISGVSQQIPELRFPAQMEAQVNGLPTIKNGFGKRYPAEHIARLPSTLDNFNQWHFVDRGANTPIDPFSTDFDLLFGDTEETTQYAVAFGNASIDAVDLRGQAAEIASTGDALTYLTTPDPTNDLDFITIQDFTWVLNKKKVAAMTTTVDTLRPFEALIFVASARVSSKYHVYINDVQQATFTSGTTTATVDIAIDLETDLLANLDPLLFTVIRTGSTIYVGSLDGNDFTIRTEEGDGGETLKIFKGTTDKFSSLPKLAINGFRIKIENDGDFEEDDFWVEYQSTSVTDQGSWQESRQDGLINIIDKTTMPHQLIHNAQDIWSTEFSDEFGIQPFTLTPVDWEDRLVGDDTTVPFPSFIGSVINDVFFMRNRLGFLSGENVIQSEDGQATNFWTTSLQTLLDTDPIDVGTSHSKSSTFKHAVPSQERLILFSRDTQFIYGSGDNALSPKTVFINPSSEISINEKVRPFASANSVFFGVDKKKGTSIKELSTTTSDEIVDTQDITSHVPDYIPEDLQQIEGSNVDNMMFFFSNQEQGSLFVYKFLNEGDKRVLSSWHKWTFAGTGVVINGFKGIKDNLYMVFTYNEQGIISKHLQRINLSVDYLNTGLGHALMLDRLKPVLGVYNSTTLATTWNLPYDDTSELKIVLGPVFSVPGSEIKQANITRPTVTSLAAPGDYSAGVCYIGKKYETSTTLTQPMLKSVDDGSPKVDRTATYTVSSFTTHFYQSSGFQVDVTYKDGTTRPYKYSGFLTQNTDFTIGQFNFNSDSWRVPVRTKGGRQVTVKVYDAGYVPFNVYAGQWTMNITRKQGRF